MNKPKITVHLDNGKTRVFREFDVWVDIVSVCGGGASIGASQVEYLQAGDYLVASPNRLARIVRVEREGCDQ